MKDFLEKNLNDAPMLGAFVNQSEEIKVEGFELIKVEERDGKQAVNGRGLHQFLGIGKDFSSWIKKQIERCDLVENQDFEVFTEFGENPNGGRPTIEYALSIDMAKELAMVENNEKGRAIRKYFIEKEQEAKRNILAMPNFNDPVAAARAWADQYEKNRQLVLENQRKEEELEKSNQEVASLSATITQMQPKVSYYDMILANKSTVTVTQVAQDYGMSARAFNKKLHELKLQRKVGGQWILYQPYLDKGYVHSRPVDIPRSNGKIIKYNTEWTQKGRLFLYDFLKQYDILPKIEQTA